MSFFHLLHTSAVTCTQSNENAALALSDVDIFFDSGVKGPGRVIIFPWMDRTKRIDVRAAAFAVPPQQFITCDGGIVEMGAEIQYGIVDVVTMVSEVADHQDILRSLGKTLVVKVCVKRTVTQLEKDRRTPAQAIQDDLNDQVNHFFYFVCNDFWWWYLL